MALASLGLLAVSLLLGNQAISTPESSLGRFSVKGEFAQIGTRRLALPGGDIGFEYLQVDHELLGYHQVIALALLSRDRVPFTESPLKQFLATHLRQHADAYAQRGLTVRHRTNRARVNSGQEYEVVDRGGQVVIRRAQDTPPAASSR